MDELSVITLKNICCTCLSVDRKLNRLCNVEDGINNLFFLLSCDSEAYEVLCYKEAADLVICWECEALLCRVCKFREQACIAQKRLQEIVDNTKNTQHTNLSQLSHYHQNSYNYEYILTNENGFETGKEDENDLIKSDSDTEFLCLSDLLNSDSEIEDVNETDVTIDNTNNVEPKNETILKKGVQKTEIRHPLNKIIVEENINYTTIKMSEQEMRESREQRRAAPSFLEAEFRCDTCIEIYKDDLVRQLHMNEAHEGLPKFKKCDICKVYVREKWFDEHRSDHYLKYQCHYCDHISYNVLVILKHLRVGHAVKNIPKEVRKLRKKSYLKNPGSKPWSADVAPDKNTSIGYICSRCNEFFNTKKERMIHIQKVHKKPDYKCSACGKTFSAPHSLMNHERLHTGTLPRQPCPICGKLIRYDTMKSHLKVHSDRKSVKCYECDKSFVSYSSYLHHLKFTKTHAGNDAYKLRCPICNRGFRTKSDRRDHINYRHRGKTNHKCPICDKIISSGKLLTRHLKETHYGEKKETVRKIYLCQTCGKVCRDITALREHESWHTGDMPLCCELCGRRYRTGGALSTHKKVVHNVIAKRLLLKHTESDIEDDVEDVEE